MPKGEKKKIKRRLTGAYLSSVISISLVLLLIGVAAALILNAGRVSNYFKENPTDFYLELGLRLKW